MEGVIYAQSTVQVKVTVRSFGNASHSCTIHYELISQIKGGNFYSSNSKQFKHKSLWCIFMQPSLRPPFYVHNQGFITGAREPMPTFCRCVYIENH